MWAVRAYVYHTVNLITRKKNKDNKLTMEYLTYRQEK